MLRKLSLCLFLSGLTLASLVLGASSTQTPSDPNSVYVHVTARDRHGHTITGLVKENFKVLEDNVRQDIAFFSEDSGPVSIGVLLDGDSATRDQARAMAFEALRTRDSRDRVFVDDIEKRSLTDAVYETLQKLLAMENRRVLVLFTMKSNLEGYSFAKVRELLKDKDIQMYAISTMQNPGENGGDILRDLTDLSGGATFFPPMMTMLPNVYANIKAQVRNQYVLGYRPTNAATNRAWRKIKVTVENREIQRLPELSIQTREGYYAPVVSTKP
jgi:Ca-activated chloride channel family protein